MFYRKSLAAALLAPIIALAAGAPSEAFAAGYAVFTHGASALGQGNAVTAHSQSPSSIFYNPALINKLEGTQIEAGTTALVVSRSFTSSLTGSSTGDDSAFFPSTFYATYKYNDKLSAGLGVFNPFGLGTEWKGDWEGRFIATKSRLTTFNINPVLSYRVLPNLSIAGGLDVIVADASLERRIPAGLPGGPAVETGVKFKADGSGLGYNVGVAWDITDDLTFGASYRSSVHLLLQGDSRTNPTFSFTFPAPPFPVVAPFDVDGRASLRLQPQVTAAFAWRVTPPLTVEAGMRWEGWSAFRELAINLDNGQTLATPRDWHDSWGFNLGGRYQLNDTVALLGGYVYGDSSVPDSTFDPSIPDATTHVFCAGTDLSYQRFKLGLAYAYQLYEDRTKNNAISGGLPSPPFSQANGRYETSAHLIAVSAGYRF